MFRNDFQRARVCKALLDSLGKGRYWTEMGPTEAAIELYEKGTPPWSHGEQILWHVAWSVWTGNEQPLTSFSEMVYTFDVTRLRLVGSLMSALCSLSGASLDRWLAEWEKPLGGCHDKTTGTHKA